MDSKINKNDLSNIDINVGNEVNRYANSKEKENKIDSIIESGDSFINICSTIFETFMFVMNWVMKNAYLIAVLIIAILFVFKLKNWKMKNR